jgi:hypothetical protein
MLFRATPRQFVGNQAANSQGFAAFFVSPMDIGIASDGLRQARIGASPSLRGLEFRLQAGFMILRRSRRL